MRQKSRAARAVAAPIGVARLLRGPGHRLPPPRGFSLIELLVVLIILGVLAAVAIPKFIALDRDARIAELKAQDGAMSS